MEYVDTVVIGAGVIGLALARALAMAGREVLILEAESAIGSVTSSRNSGVIHAGIYYKPGSLKARCCVKGRDMLYAYAAERGIGHRRCGKLIVATDDTQIPKLNEWKSNAELKRPDRLAHADPRRNQERSEPGGSDRHRGLHVPMSGIVVVHEYMLALLGDAEAAGATLVLRSPVEKGEVSKDGFVLEVGGAQPMKMSLPRGDQFRRPRRAGFRQKFARSSIRRRSRP